MVISHLPDVHATCIALQSAEVGTSFSFQHLAISFQQNADG